MRRVDSSLLVALSISMFVHGSIIFGLGHLTLQNRTISPVFSRLTVTLAPFSTTDAHLASINPPENAALAQETKTRAVHPYPPSVGSTSLYAPSVILDAPPSVVQDISDNPDSLATFTQGGKSILILRVGEDGTVIEIDEEFTDLPREVAEDVKRSFFQIRFYPGTINGKATKFFMRIETRIKAKHDYPDGRFVGPTP